MKKIITSCILLIAIIFLTGCSQQKTIQTQTQASQPIVTSQTLTDRLSQYGEKTKRRERDSDPFVFNGPELGSGKLLHRTENKSTDQWYFVKDGGKRKEGSAIIEEKYSLIINEECLIHAVGFTNGSCVKYLSINENKNVLYDGYNGASVIIFGKILSDKAIRVSDIMLQQ